MTSITWSGYNWYVKSGNNLGPGPNNWSDSPNSVFVDVQNRLHLTISGSRGQWYCTEIWSYDTFGYGNYTFNLAANSQIDVNAVLGLFTYLDDYHEVDIEYSKWGSNLDLNNAGFTVQPASPGGYHPSYRFNMPMDTPSQNSFTWNPTKVDFLTKNSSISIPWSETDYVPPSSTEKVHLNFWLYNGSNSPPSSNQEVIIDSFEFTKYDCVQGVCQPVPNGRFTDPACQNSCITALKYDCINNQCVQSSTGPYTEPTCNSVCTPQANRYNCVNSQCVASTTGLYPDITTCQSICSTSITGCPSNNVKILGSCISQDFILVGLFGAVFLVALAK